MSNQSDLIKQALAYTPAEDTIDDVNEPIIPKGVMHKPALYALGGCGIKIASRIPNISDQYLVTTIDTSKSEDQLLKGHINRVYLTDATDGSGAVKKAKYKVLKDGIPPIIDSTDPTDICYVVFSASGASGSTASFILIDELLERGKSVIAICSVNANNELRTKNTVKTLLGLHNLCVKHTCNIPLFLGLNEHLVLQDAQNAAFISASSCLLNPGIVGIDTSDRKNFLSPCYIADIGMEPSLISISLATGESDAEVDENKFSSSLLLTSIGGKEGASTGSKVVFSGLLDVHTREYLTGVLPGQDSYDMIALNTSFAPPYELMAKLKNDCNEYDKKTTLARQANTRIMSEVSPGGSGGDIVL